MKHDRESLKTLLNVSMNALKLIEKRGHLKQRLNKKGYDLIDRYKDKNKYIYIIEKKSSNQARRNINIIYNTNKTESFIDYFNIRTIETPRTIKQIAEQTNVAEKTVIKWDNTLQDKRILSKDGFYYFKMDKLTEEIIEVSKEEYKTFWKNRAYLNAFESLQEKYLKGEITLTELQLTSGDIAVIISMLENKYYFKIKKYKVNRNEIFKLTKKLINEYKKVSF